MTWTVHKFGGTSVADASCIRLVAGIIGGQRRGNLAVVVSAMKGVTDDLLGLVDKAAKRQPVEPTLKALRARHEKANVELLGAAGAKTIMAEFDQDLADIDSILKALSLVRAASHRSRDLVSGYGEIWSARQIAAFFKQEFGKTRDVMFLNARDVLVIEHTEMGPIASWDLSRPKLAAAIPPTFNGVAVVTGFVASDKEGLPTTLGRNGSDYSASIFGALLDADEVHIWTDVDGVMSGDPRQVPEAKIIDEMSYSEAMELAYFGAKVIHPQTMAPAVGRGIPLWIRNTFNATHPGTKISASSGSRAAAVKGISGVDKVALVNLEGAGMIGVPGTADRLFGALRDAGVSVMLISQGSSEHSICFAVREEAADQVRTVVERAFAVELSEGQVQRVGVTKACAIIAVVGDDMAGMPGSAGRFFGTLGNAGINVRAIAQGASERNISAVIDAKDMTRAIRAVHSSFYLSAKTVSIGVLGPGHVGGTLLDQLASAAPALRTKFNLDLRVRAIGGSSKMLLDEQRLDLAKWRDSLAKGVAMDADKLVAHIQADYLPHAVLIDCTANQGVADRYADWLQRGIHVITPNKRAHSGPIAYYQDLKRLSRGSRTHFLYEATVGAGLPDHPDAERPRRDRRRDPQHQRYLLRHARVPVQSVRWHAAVLGNRSRSQSEGLHGARSARRPLGHGRGSKSRDPRARGGAHARARRHRSRESRPAGAGERVGRRVPEASAGLRRADGGAGRSGKARRASVALRRNDRRARREGEGRPRVVRADAIRSPTSASPTTSCSS